MDFFTGSQKSGFLSFDMISPRNLEKFDKWMHDQGYSKTTTGIYLRCLRCVFNDAIRSGAIHPKKYPFGQRKYGLYAIPRGYNIKKALSEEQIKLIKGHSIQPGTKEAMARDFWMLSFYCAGINLSDLLRLRNKDFDGGAIKFVRRKTRDSLLKVEPTEVLLVKDGIDIIERYRSAKKSDNAYLFEVVDSSKPEAIQRKQIKNFNRSLDYGLKRLAKSVKLEVKLSFYHARHSFANIALNKNVPLSYISDQLSHSSISTTKLYLKGISRSNKMKTVKTIIEGL
jgi:integrase